ncbi:hypothetical protein OSB04_019897, partial [Centaurea solstitialis]
MGRKRKTIRQSVCPTTTIKKRSNTLRTRTSPRTLYETIIGLTPGQRKAVEDMGLGSLLSMTVDGVPVKMGFFVVDSFNTTKMQLETTSGNIPITVDSIHHLLKLLTGGLDLMNLKDLPSGVELVKEWKKQFGNRIIRPMDVMRLILKTDNSGVRFKMNFLVLFVNLMAECNSMGSCQLQFLSKIDGDNMLLYVTSTISKRVVVAESKSALSSWNIGLL